MSLRGKASPLAARLYRAQVARMSTTSSAGAAVNATAATDAELQPAIAKMMPSNKSAVLHRSLKAAPPQVVSANGKYLTFSNGQTILDTTCGAAVACIGSNNERVKKAMIAQLDKFAYCNSMFFGHPIGEELADELIRGTDGLMSKAYIMCSGSEAMDAAMKMARQYFVEIGQPQRVRFIARENSYHGTTLGSLSMGGHVARRSLFTDMLLPNIGRVSPCNAYRGMTEGQTVEQYVEQLANELDRKFQEMGPETVCAFVAEPIVGAALGCVPSVPGYFKAMKNVCDKYGALLIFDEVMSGMGRCGTLHAWQHEGVTPDIQTMAKGLGGGYAPVAAHSPMVTPTKATLLDAPLL
ncbi:putative aminotransferase [Colletotrichum sp. SAR 10_99]|nr:putative aminotransferase [Colletotrichum sp. SAR 10_99]